MLFDYFKFTILFNSPTINHKLLHTASADCHLSTHTHTLTSDEPTYSMDGELHFHVTVTHAESLHMHTHSRKGSSELLNQPLSIMCFI